MPCDQRIQIAIDWRNTNLDTLETALKALGLKPVMRGNTLHFHGRLTDERTGRGMDVIGIYENGKMTYSAADNAWAYSRQLDAVEAKSVENTMRRAYSEQVIAQAAKRFNWRATKSKNKAGNTTFMVER